MSRRYEVTQTDKPVYLNGKADVAPWSDAEAALIDEFPWYQSGQKQGTAVRMLYDDYAIYLQFVCEDTHISSQCTELNGPVCEDSCVEFFASPFPRDREDYFNLELNACGYFMIGYGAGREGRELISPELAQRVCVVTSVPGPTREESSSDEDWWASVQIPFDVLGEFIGQPVRPESGTIWRCNFYQCGGTIDPQYAAWNRIDPGEHPTPDYHRPEYFGELHFA